MKKTGSTADFIPQRDEELLNAFKRELHHLGTLRAEEIFRRAAHRRASRFWVSEDRAAIVISRMLKGDKLEYMNKKKREMYFEIYWRVKSILDERPELPLSSAVFEVVNSPAPEFYLTEKSAKVIIYRLRA